MNYFHGYDLAVGLSRGSSRNCVCVLNDDTNVPEHLEYMKPETNNLSKRFKEIAAFYTSVNLEFKPTAILIPRPKMSGVRFEKYNPKTKQKETISTTPRSLFDLCEVRGHIIEAVMGLQINCEVMYYLDYTEGQIKKDFTGSGRASKDEVFVWVRSRWPGCPNNADASDAYMHAWVCRYHASF